jgi:hypothetical protein
LPLWRIVLSLVADCFVPCGGLFCPLWRIVLSHVADCLFLVAHCLVPCSGLFCPLWRIVCPLWRIVLSLVADCSGPHQSTGGPVQRLSAGKDLLRVKAMERLSASAGSSACPRGGSTPTSKLTPNNTKNHTSDYYHYHHHGRKGMRATTTITRE